MNTHEIKACESAASCHRFPSVRPIVPLPMQGVAAPGPMSFSHANCTAALEPGVEMTTFPRYTPAVARESIAAAPT